jgi:hypothetical protein
VKRGNETRARLCAVLVAIGASAYAVGSEGSVAASPRAFLLRLHDAGWVAGTRVACLVETRPGAATNGLLCFKHTAKLMSLTPEPNSYAAVMAEGGVSVIDTTTHKIAFLWAVKAAPHTFPAGCGQAAPLPGGVALLHVGDYIFVRGTHIICGVVGGVRVVLLLCDTANEHGVQFGSYDAQIADEGIQVLGPVGPRPGEKALFFRRFP